MREDDAVAMDAGPRVTKMYRLMVEYLAERDGVPMSRVYQAALEALIADTDWTRQELEDYYGRRADALDTAMHEMKLRGIQKRRNTRKKDVRLAA